jgi:hypothetical protein
MLDGRKRKPGWLARLLCVELDAVTSQRGATGAEAAFLAGLGPVRSPGIASSCQVQDRRTCFVEQVEDPKERGNRQGKKCKLGASMRLKVYLPCISRKSLIWLVLKVCVIHRKRDTAQGGVPGIGKLLHRFALNVVH